MRQPDQMTASMDAAPHVVLKRGHRGRYRFTVMTQDATVSGRVQVDPTVTDKEQADALARRRIRELADAIAFRMGTDGFDGNAAAGSVPEAVGERT